MTMTIFGPNMWFSIFLFLNLSPSWCNTWSPFSQDTLIGNIELLVLYLRNNLQKKFSSATLSRYVGPLSKHCIFIATSTQYRLDNNYQSCTLKLDSISSDKTSPSRGINSKGYSSTLMKDTLSSCEEIQIIIKLSSQWCESNKFHQYKHAHNHTNLLRTCT